MSKRSTRICIVDGCEKREIAKGLCPKHYRDMAVYGVLNPGRKKDPFGTIEERLERNISYEPNSGCWLWSGAISNRSYGSIFYEGRMQKAHRVTWTLRNGPIPEGLELDHLCRTRSCCNPDHLEPVTREENLRRGEHKNGKQGVENCPLGHPYSPENTMIRKETGWRTCRTCARHKTRLWREAKKIEKASAYNRIMCQEV